MASKENQPDQGSNILHRFESAGFKNWIKCSLGLVETKDALGYSILSRFASFYKSHLFYENWGHWFSDINDHHFNHHRTQQCKVAGCLSQFHRDHDVEKGIKRHRGKWECRNDCCRCAFIFDSVLKICTDPSSSGIYWSNSQVLQIPTNLQEWEIAKVFMPKGHKDNKGLKDTDAAAIFNIINKCKLFGWVDHNVLDKLIVATNKVMHSGDKEITREEMVEYIDLMITLLKFNNGNVIGDITHPPFKDRPECQSTAEQLENFKDAEIEVASMITRVPEELVYIRGCTAEIVEREERQRNELQRMTHDKELLVNYVSQEKESLVLLKRDVESMITRVPGELAYIGRCAAEIIEREERQRNELQRMTEEKTLLVNHVNREKESLDLLKNHMASMTTMMKSDMTNVANKLTYLRRRVTELAERDDLQRERFRLLRSIDKLKQEVSGTECFVLVLVLVISLLAAFLLY